MRLGAGAGAVAGGRLAPGETFTVRFRVRVRDATPSGTVIDDAARANFVAETLGFALEAQTNVTHLVTVAPDLAIAKRHDGTLAPGTAGTYVIAVRNAGDGPTHGEVHVHDALPAGVAAASAAGAGWACAVVAGVVDCTRADALAPGDAYPDIAVPVDVAFDAAPPLENIATVAGGGEDDPANDEAIDSANPEPAADLAVAKTRGARRAATGPGRDVRARGRQRRPRRRDRRRRRRPDAGRPHRARRRRRAGLVRHERAVHAGHAHPRSARPRDHPRDGRARCAGRPDRRTRPRSPAALRDPNPGNDRATAAVSVRATADVRLGKRLLGTAHAGSPVAWAITAVNHGPHRADGLVVVDPLPHAVEDPAATVVVGGGHCAVADRVARCTLHALAPGERAEVRISGRLGPHAGGTFLDNGAELFEHEQDPAPRAAAHSDQVIVGPAADVEITADATPMVPVPGGQLTYHVRVEDGGPGTARGVRFAERLPSAVTPIAVPTGCAIAAQVVRCDVGPLSPGTALGFDIVVRVSRDAARELLRARLSVGGAEPDPASADNRDVARTSVGRAPPQPHFTG